MVSKHSQEQVNVKQAKCDNVNPLQAMHPWNIKSLHG